MSSHALRCCLLELATFSASAPSLAAWRTESEAVRAATQDPRAMAALQAMDAMDAATIARDQEGFVGRLAPDLAVNSPGNVTVTSEAVARSFAAGRINYSHYDRLLDHVAVRPSGEVVAMGSETVLPRGAAPEVGKTVTRRFTDVWRNDAGRWRLVLRQATVVEIVR